MNYLCNQFGRGMNILLLLFEKSMEAKDNEVE